MEKESFCLKVPKATGETALSLTNRLGLTNKSLLILKEGEKSLCIPLTRKLDAEELSTFNQFLPEFNLSKQLFQEKKQPQKTLEEILADQLPPHLIASLPHALDVIGDIAIIEVPPELEPYKSILGQAILEKHRNVHVVLAKAGPIAGTFRIRDFEFIAGEHRTTTLHKEFGCNYQVDVAKAYFSPRLSHEHQRVASLILEGETVVDLFAGVGPFAILIAKTHRNSKVYAIDINADAVDLLKKNARLNRVETRVFPIVGDSRKIVDEQLMGLADRVIMNLPETASEFIDVACKAIKPSGGIVHFYGFIRLPETIEDMKRQFCEAVEKSGRKVSMIRHAKTVRATAPYEYQAVIDAEIQ
jgi:tRNA (guanine37-N1)-methyltransferase